MARPTKPKDLKPKAEGEAGHPAPGAAPAGGGGALDLKFIILLVVTVLVSILGSVGSTYLVATLFITPEIQKMAKAPAEGEHAAAEGAHGGEAEPPAVGMNLELDEFMVNLKADPALTGSQYLRTKMALSIKPPDAENCYIHKAAMIRDTLTPSNGKIVGAAAPISEASSQKAPIDRTMLANEGGEGGPPPCATEFKASMSKFVPTIRDVVNASLMKRTASQLSTLEGQETLKDEIKEQLSQIMAPEYEVLRVNFQDFIIQR